MQGSVWHIVYYGKDWVYLKFGFENYSKLVLVSTISNKKFLFDTKQLQIRHKVNLVLIDTEIFQNLTASALVHNNSDPSAWSQNHQHIF